MRIDRFDLLAFGRFTDTSLDLSDGDQGLHLIYGNNEAGKSTSLRGLVAWLFGIPARTTDNFTHPNPQLRIGGRLRLVSGQTLDFMRRKGNKGTLLDPGSGDVLDDGLLVPFIPSGIDESLFRNLYGIDHDRLVAGGRELLDQSGDIGQALFSAAAGTAGLRDVVAKLREGAETLFKPRASTRVINQALAGYKDARKRIKEATLPVAEWKRLHKELDETLAEIESVEGVIRSACEEKSRLERLARVKGPLAERRGVLEQLDGLAEVALLPDDFEESCRMARKDFADADKAGQKGRAKLELLEEEGACLNIRQDLLDNAAIISDLFKELGAVETAIKDRPRQDGQRSHLRNEAKRLLGSVRPDVSLSEVAKVERLRPVLGNKKWVVALAKQYDLLAQDRENVLSRMRDIEDEQAQAGKDLLQIPPVRTDLREIKAIVAAARKAGDLESRLADGQQRAREAVQAMESGFAALGRYGGAMDGLASVPMPVAETLDDHEKQFDELHDARKDARTRLEDIVKEHKSVEQELKALLLQDDVPTLVDLETSRSTRNQGWELIKGRYIEQRDIEEAVTAFAPSGDLPGVYEKCVRKADSLSDVMRAGSDLVAKRATLETRLEELAARRGKLEKELEAFGQAEEQLTTAWKNIWQPLDIEPGKPREMKQWLLRAQKLIAEMQSARLTVTQAQRINEELLRHREAVAAQIALFDRDLSTNDMGLSAMIEWCEQRIEDVQDRLKQRAQLQKSLDGIGRRMDRAREELTAVEGKQATWREEWAQAVQGLGVAADAHPEQALSSLERMEGFFKTFDDSEGLRRRIFGIDRVVEEFGTKVFDLAQRAGWDLDGRDARTLVAQLNRDVAEARDARATLKKINVQKKDVREEMENAAITMNASREKLAELRELAKVTRDEDLEKAGGVSRKKRERIQRLEILDKELARNGDGLSIEELEKEYENARIDTMDDELDRVRSTLEEHQKKRDGLRDVRQTLQNDIQAKDGSAQAAGASQDAQEQLAVITSGAEEYLRLRIAGQILEQRIEAYRQENQGPLLGRAGELFARLTMGSYAGLRDELDSGGHPVLLGIRPSDDEVPVEHMSEGTRDQLYLALRLATLEKHLGEGEPMPFVVDDILIGFDDNRTRVCLEVLAELATRTQVLIFTHHNRVLELAGGIKARSGIFVHRL
ncbi:AAA family ATPase [Desulfoplanes sp.]